jgi:hypothetical protein
VVRWSGGQVVRWAGGQVVRGPGGPQVFLTISCLQPVRVELVHREPDILLFHQVIRWQLALPSHLQWPRSPRELEDVKSVARPHLARSQVAGRGGD